MKKKATSSSSDGIYFQSLFEARDFVDERFDKLIDLYTSGRKGKNKAFIIVPCDISEREKEERLEAYEKLREKVSEELHSIRQQLLSLIAELYLLDPFGDSSKLFHLLADEADSWTNRDFSRGFIYQNLTERLESERNRIIQGLPGYLAYQQSKATTKSKKNRNPEAIKKEKDFLYLLDQYDRWKTKTSEVTGRKKLNPKDWLQEYDRWNNKTLAIYRKYVSIKSKDGTLRESDPSSKDAQGRIDSIIKYAQKIKRERSERDE